MALVADALAVAVIAAAGICWLLGSVVLDQARWLAALDSADAWDRAGPAIAAQLVRWSDSQAAGGSRPLGPLDEGDVTVLVTALTPPAILRAQTASFVASLLGGVGADGRVHAVLELAPLRQRLTGSQATAVVMERMATWPVCTAAQEARLLTSSPPRCRPGSVSLSVVAPVVAALFVAVASGLPATVDLAVSGPTPGSGILAGTGVIEGVAVAAAARAAVPSLVLAAALLLALAAAAQGPRPRRMLRVVGLPLVVAAVALAVAGWLVSAVAVAAGDALGPALAARGAVPALADLAAKIAHALVAGTGDLLVPPAGALALGGAVLVVLSLLLPAGRSAR